VDVVLIDPAERALSPHERANREFWDREADRYQAEQGVQAAWGVWSLPEAELNVLGEVAGKDVLELGCGAAQWGIALTRRGARVVGLDVSERQLEHARAALVAAGLDFPLLCAGAEAVPLPEASFDVVFADWGATAFCDPYAWVPEAARLLRPGGLLAFSGATPLSWLCLDLEADAWDERLHRDLFGLHRLELPDGTVEFALSTGEWIRLFRVNGLEIEDLIELRPAEGATSTFRSERGLAWARQWPLEQIWKVRKR
jgi:SAM-dependent methyltransferase